MIRCSINNCKRKYHAKEWCELHYRRYKRYGDPLKLINFRDRICKVVNCNIKHHGKGYCSLHFDRWRLHGDPLWHDRIRDPTRKCSITKCVDKYCAKGLCSRHYDIKHKREYIRDPKRQLKNRIKNLKKLGLELDIHYMRINRALSNWSKLVKIRDKFRCKICNSKEKLISHHILYKNKHPKKSLDVYNGVTLCNNCHHVYHDLNDWK